MKKVVIYTDGACSGNPGKGGYAAILFYNNNEKVIVGREKLTTNNRMELIAIIEAIKQLNQPCFVDIYSDSAYCVNAINEGWLMNWQRNDFKKGGSDIKNIDLWKEYLTVSKAHKIKFIKVKGHSDNEFNNRCDKLARDAIISD